MVFDETPQRFRSESAAATVLVAVLLVAAAAIVFGRTVAFDFINFDDPYYVSDNPHVSGGLTASDITWVLTQRHASNWHPLTWISHMLDCQIYGLKPWGHHLTNLLLHAATSVVLFLVFRKMTGAFLPSALVAAIFAVHPLRVESVAWIAERKRRSERSVIHAHPGRLSPVCRAALLCVAIRAGDPPFRAGPGGQTDARHPAVRLALAGLLAAGTPGRRRGVVPGKGARRPLHAPPRRSGKGTAVGACGPFLRGDRAGPNRVRSSRSTGIRWTTAWPTP